MKLPWDFRPLDPLHSIKLKIGVLVGASIAAASVVFWVFIGWYPRITVLTAAAVALVVTQVLAHGMTSPLREMTAAARAMAEGDYSRRVRATSRDEVGELAHAFNKMAADLQTVDQQRRELIANVSHELRTPISALHAVLENVVDGVAQPDPETLRAALVQADRLSRLVRELLDLSRIDAGAIELRPRELDVRPFLEDVARAAEVAGRPVEVVIDVEPEDLRVVADAGRLHQVVANLLDNATRHGPPDGQVVVTARPGRHHGGLVLEVVDEGPGIPPEERDRVFERFTRGDGPTTGGGTGLGLAIARWAVDLHGGAIAVVDNGPGCRIRVTIPDRPSATIRGGTMTSTVERPPAPPPAFPAVARGSVFGEAWPRTRRPAPRAVLAAAAGAGVVGALVLPLETTGVGIPLTGVALAAATFAAGRPWRRPAQAIAGGLALALLGVAASRAADWLFVLCAMAAFGLGSLALAGTRTWPGMILGTAVVPLGAPRATRWSVHGVLRLGRGRMDRLNRAVWVTAVTVLLLLVFGSLLAGADRGFAKVLDAVVPDVELPEIPDRMIVLVVVTGLALVSCYVMLNPPQFDRYGDRPARPVRRFEWIIPLAVLNALFLAFVVVNVVLLAGGADYVRDTAGLTYAEYARQGFWQLLAVTMLTLAVVGVAARKAPRASRSDRMLMRVFLGALCVLALAIVVSALRRMQMYEHEYGLTRLRVFVFAVEVWLGLVFLFVLGAGVRLRGRWVARAVVFSGAVLLLALAALNPDRFIADRNVDRFEATQKIDVWYLSELSADAVPALDRLPEPYRSCALGHIYRNLEDAKEPWYAYNVGRDRARKLLNRNPPDENAVCP